KINAGGTIVQTAGGPGVSAGRYLRPVGLATAPNGRLLVTDSDDGRITVLDQNLRVVEVVGANGAGVDAFDLPFATLATSTGYVGVDTWKKRILRTDQRWLTQDQIVSAPVVPTGRRRPLVYGTSDSVPRAYPMLPGIDVAADLGLRSPLRFV